MSFYAAVFWVLLLHCGGFATSVHITVRDNDVPQNHISPWVIKGIILGLLLFLAAFLCFYLYRRPRSVGGHPTYVYRVPMANRTLISPVMGRRPLSSQVVRSSPPSTSVTSHPSSMKQPLFHDRNTVINSLRYPPTAHTEAY